MRKKLLVLVPIAVVIAALPAAGCGSSTKTTPSTTTPKPSSTTKTYTIAETNITAKVGDRFVIELKSNATTGYKWEMTGPLSPAVVKVSDVYVASPNPQSAMGSGGVEKWTFKAVSAGDAAIQMEYMPPGGGEASEKVTFDVTVS